MRHLPDSFDAAVDAFRDMTAAPEEGEATRARVLARTERQARRRSRVRRGMTPLAVVLASLLSGAGLTAAAMRWRAPAPVEIADLAPAPSAAGFAHPKAPTRTVPALRADDRSSPSPDGVDAEALAYERAHQVHFFADAPARALAAWDAYLAAFPRGTFAPEARFNRALCLARLGRFVAAAQALRPFAAGRAGGYRRQEACTLLRWLAERDARVGVTPACPDGG
jgi:TolA-binding protein